MPVKTSRELKELLFATYGGFADKRIKNLDRDEPFIVDDRTDGDYDARHELYLWFCIMSVRVRDERRVTLAFRGGVPMSADVNEWIRTHGGVETNLGFEVDITPESVNNLDDLANRMLAIIKRRYEVPAYKYVVPRTVDSIARLSKMLRGAWN